MPCSTPGCSFSVPRSFLMVLAFYVARADNPKSTLCVVVQVRLHGGLHELSPSVLAARVSPWVKKSRMVCTKPCIPAIGEVVHATSNQGALQLALNTLVCPDDARGGAGFPVSCCGFTDRVKGSPLPSTRCLMAPCPVTRLSHVRETARPGGGRVCRLRCVAYALLRSAGLPRLCRLACLGDGGIPQDDFAGISRQCFCLTRGNSAACYPRMRPSCDRPGLSTEGVTQRARMLAPCTDFADWGRGSPAPLLVALQLAIALSLKFLEIR